MDAKLDARLGQKDRQKNPVKQEQEYQSQKTSPKPIYSRKISSRYTGNGHSEQKKLKFFRSRSKRHRPSRDEHRQARVL